MRALKKVLMRALGVPREQNDIERSLYRQIMLAEHHGSIAEYLFYQDADFILALAKADPVLASEAEALENIWQDAHSDLRAFHVDADARDRAHKAYQKHASPARLRARLAMLDRKEERRVAKLLSQESWQERYDALLRELTYALHEQVEEEAAAQKGAPPK